MYVDPQRHADGKKSAFQKTTLRSSLTALQSAQPKSILLRDGEVVSTRAYADARVQRIYGGTNEIMKEVIARSMGLNPPRS